MITMPVLTGNRTCEKLLLCTFASSMARRQGLTEEAVCWGMMTRRATMPTTQRIQYDKALADRIDQSHCHGRIEVILG